MTHYLSLFLLLLAFSCANVSKHNSSAPAKDKPLLTVANESVTVEEFLYAYNKNNQQEDRFSKADVDEYLDLYVNFKLKVVEAVNLGYDTSAIFKQEFAGYKEQLDKSYLNREGETRNLVIEAYERLQTEVKASHILVEVPPNALPEDTAAAYLEIISIREEIENGLDFGTAAVKYSQDPSAQTNKGSLGYFSAMQMVYPFENAAFNTPVGQISMPVKTQFGYHIIKVEDRRPAEGKVSVAHIMIRPPNANSETKIMTIYEQLLAGADWNETCKIYSQDQNTAQRGGELPPFGKGQIVPEFEQVAFSLEQPGQISDPFQTQFGWHIIKLLKKIPLGSFEEMEETLSRQVTRDARAEINQQALIKKLKSENGFSQVKEGYELMMNTPNHKFIKSKWRFDSTDFNIQTPLFSIKKQNYSLGMFYEYIAGLPKQDSSRLFLHNQYQKFSDNEIINYEINHLADKYEDYGFLLNEYHDGILLFSIMEDVVWNKAVVDSAGLKSYYNGHLDQYSHAGGWQATIYSSPDSSILNAIWQSHDQQSESKLLSDVEKQSLLGEYNEVSPLSLQIEQDDYFLGEENILNTLTNQAVDTIIRNGDQWYYIQVHQLLASGVKPLSEIQGSVMSDYQTYLENIWVAQLREKYPVVINEEILKNVYGPSKGE